MGLIKKFKIGELVQLIDERNIFGIRNFYGLNINKEFMPTVASTEGLNEKRYKVVRKNRFVYSGMQTGRDECIRISMYTEDIPIIVSPAYITFEIIAQDYVNSQYFFMFFCSKEKDRLGWFYSDSSVRSNLDWNIFCDLEIELPDIAIQQKYVDMYQAMLANQQSYERGLEDLKQTIDIELEKIKYSAVKLPLSALLEVIDFRNENGKITNIQGIDINKTFISSTVKSSAVNIKNYKIVKKGQFAYSSMQTGRDECIRIALLEKDEPIIISPAYSVLQVKNEKVVPEFIMLWFMRKEMDRYGWFASDASIRASLELDSFFQIKIPIPELEIQQCIVDIYKSYIKRKEINERLKAQIKDICPVLIKGALEEARK